MTLHIAPVNALVFALGCLVAHLVYVRARKSHPHRAPGPEHLAAAIASGAAVVASLAVLLGVGDGSGAGAPRGEPSPGVSSSVTPPP